jgi:hypothetical protein
LKKEYLMEGTTLARFVQLFLGVVPTRKFPLGITRIASSRVLNAFDKASQTPLEFLARHAKGDWGEVGPEDAAHNDVAPEKGLRLLSAYKLSTGVQICVITEADRSSTCILLLEEC